MDTHPDLSPASATEPTGAAPLLEARGLSVVPPGADHPAVRDLSLSVRPGEWVALVGENGGGKSTLLHALAGLWSISSGTLELEGHPFGPSNRERAAGTVAAILQDPGSQILMSSVADELAFTARNLGIPEPEVAGELQRWTRALGVEVDPAQDPASCSAGQQQRILLAAALATRPRLLLADEPTAHLDEAGRSAVRALIQERVAGGTAVIWATQDPREIAAATRTVEVGGRAAPAAHRGSARPADPLPHSEVLRISVTGLVPERGPRVTIRHSIEIAVGGSGVTAFLGPNGAGKSVLLLAAAGVEHAAQVSVQWKKTPETPPIVALQYPEQQVFEDVVADELAFAAISRGMDRPRALTLAANALRELCFDADDMLRRRTWTLSTGEKRLIEVTGALIAPAALLLLDEPTAGLDPRRRASLAGLVARRAASGPVVVATQDLDWLGGLEAVRIELGR